MRQRLTRLIPLAGAATVLLTILTIIPAAQGGGQGAPPPAPAAAGGGGGRGGVPAAIDLATAKKMVDAAEAAATAASARVAIAVVDANGDLVYFRRLDGAAGQAIPTSQGKARAAILFGMPTKDVQDAVAAGKPVTATVTPSGVGTTQVTVQQGGIPVIKNGKVVAGIGVGGAAPAMDEAFAKAGADAVK